ncbi:MAG: Imm26 family immunity protein [Candidatus Roizmanbacteria bacterium]
MVKKIRSFIELNHSRKPVDEGDIFVCSPQQGEFIWGRVIKGNGIKVFAGNEILVYFYNVITTSSNIIPSLDKNNLLIPPQFVIKQYWSSGDFETIEKRSLKNEEILNVHCFYDGLYKKYVNEFGQDLDKKYEPCGTYGFPSAMLIAKRLKEALAKNQTDENT